MKKHSRTAASWPLVPIAAVGVALVFLAALSGHAYDPPAGGWTYRYEGDSAAAGAAGSFDSLDGTWDHANGSDEWDGTGIGAGRPGGFSALDGYLRIQDAGDPRDYAMGDPGSNRKLMVAHSITGELGAAADAILDTGVTISFRARVATGAPLDDEHPDGGGGITPWAAGGNGYVIHDGGKGNLSVQQKSGGIVSFSLALAGDHAELGGKSGLVMNKLNGGTVSGDVDTGEGGTVNLLELDPTAWHEYWITIQPDPTAAGTHLVEVYVDESFTPAQFSVTAGSGDDYDALSYIAMGCGSTGQSGAVDVDFFAYAPGAQAPPAPPVGPAELVEAFIFGSRALTCPAPDGNPYTVVHHSANTCAAHNALAYGYDPGDGSGPRPYGFVVLTPGATGNNCANAISQADGLYGRFDESPNSRDKVGDACPEEIYDSFVGAKSHTQPCNEAIVGNSLDPCDPSMTVTWRDLSDPADGVLDPEPYVPNGIVFRVDVPEGWYRFVGIFGDVDNPHAHHIIAEDGGGDTPPADGTGWLIGNHVELVHNFSQRRARPEAGKEGELHVAAVGFEDKLPPMDFDPADPDPILHFMDQDGLETQCDLPNSPALHVTSGHVRIHILQGSAPSGTDKDDGGDIVLLELWRYDENPNVQPSFSVNAMRSIAGEPCAEPPVKTVTITATNVQNTATIVETLPECALIVDSGTGSPSGNTITFVLAEDGEVSYAIDLSDCCPTAGDLSIAGSVTAVGGCPSVVGGQSEMSCCPFVCDPVEEIGDAPQIVGAYLFGSRNLTCATRNDPAVDYTMVQHVNTAAGYDAITYTPEKGWGFEPVYPTQADRGWSNDGAAGMQFGPFDDTPNDRNRFSDTCPEEMYDSFIGLKNWPEQCSAATIGDPDAICAPPLRRLGAVFRVDVPDSGLYRFAAIVGEADNPHAHRLLAEDGGEGPPEEMGPNHVALVRNYDQAQFTHGKTIGDCLGCGVFGRVGFNCRVPPLGDGTGADPQFVNMDWDGMPMGPGLDGQYGTFDDPPPESPVLLVTEGHIRFHLLQGNSNDGPGGKGRNPETGIGTRDPNGTDIILLEVWKVSSANAQTMGDCDGDGSRDISDVICLVRTVFATFFLLDRTPPTVPCAPVLDVNGSGGPDVGDIVMLANYLFRGGISPGPACGTQVAGCSTNPACGE